MKTMDFTKMRKGSKTNEGKIVICPACNKKGAFATSPKLDMYLHSQKYSDSSLFRSIHESISCKVPASEERIQLHADMCLLVGGEIPHSIVSRHYWDIWKCAPDNPSRLADFRELLVKKLRKRIEGLKDKIIETDKTFQSISDKRK